MKIIDAITTRRSTRAYLDRAVAPEIIHAILDAARWAPSGVNTQPWRVAVVTGTTKQRITDRIIATLDAGGGGAADYGYYPAQWVEPYKGRRKACGLALYSALKIGRDDRERQKEAWYNNYRFFGAPVGLLFFMDREMGQGSWLDQGMFLQNVMLAALGHGLATCPQASFAEFPGIIRDELGIEERWMLLCGMALGHPDRDHPANGFTLDRVAVDDFTSWHD